MLDTNILVKSGRDFVNLFYNIPENLRMNKTEGKAVGGLRIEISVEGLQFFSKEFSFYGANSSEPFGRLTVSQLGEGRYDYRITETIVEIRKDQYGKNRSEVNRVNGYFVIEEPSPQMNTGMNTGSNAVLGY